MDDNDCGWTIGRFETSRGPLVLRDEGEFFGKSALAAYPIHNGQLTGFIHRTPLGRYKFEGAWKQANYQFPYPAEFEFDASGTTMEGRWIQGFASGQSCLGWKRVFSCEQSGTLAQASGQRGSPTTSTSARRWATAA